MFVSGEDKGSESMIPTEPLEKVGIPEACRPIEKAGLNPPNRDILIALVIL